MKIKTISSVLKWFFCVLIIQYSARASTTWTVNAVSGTDTPSSGTSLQPFLTLQYAWPHVVSGDTVHLIGGTTGSPNLYVIPNPSVGYFCQGPTNLYTSMTFFAGDSSATTIVQTATSSSNQPFSGPGTLLFGANGGQYTHPTSPFYANMTWSNVTFNDGIVDYGASNLIINNCRIIRQGPLRGDINGTPGAGLYNNKAGVLLEGGGNLTVNGCEITQTGFGIEVEGSNGWVVENNVIHDITQDGCDPVGATNGLIQGNTFYNLDDGLNSGADADPITGAPTNDWDRHCDGIQYFMPTNAASSECAFITIRGNFFAGGIERAGIQSNNFDASQTALYRCHDITIENNIFAPNVGTPIMDLNPTDNLTIRFNTIIYVPSGMMYTTQFRTIGFGSSDPSLTTNSYSLSVSGNNAQVYDNIIGPAGDTTLGAAFARFDHNIIQFSSTGSPLLTSDTQALPRGSVRTNGAVLSNPLTVAGIDPVTGANYYQVNGVLATSSPAIHAGTRLTVNQDQVISDFYATDSVGTTRHNTPSIGAVEYSGSDTTSLEPVLTLIFPGSPSTWSGDLASGLLTSDPILNTSTNLGIAWLNAVANGTNIYLAQNYNLGIGNQISEPQNIGSAFMSMSNVSSVTNFILGFSAVGTASASGGGVFFLYTDTQNFCWLDITNNSTSLHQTLAGVDTVILNFPAWTTNTSIHAWTIAVSPSAGTETVAVSRDGSPGTPATITVPFGPYSVGLYRKSTNANHRLEFGNFSLHNLGSSSTGPTGGRKSGRGVGSGAFVRGGGL